MNNSRGKVCTQDNDYGFLTGHPSHPGHRQRKLLAPHSDVVMSSAVRGSPDGSVTVTTLPRRNAHQNVKIFCTPDRAPPLPPRIPKTSMPRSSCYLPDTPQSSLRLPANTKLTASFRASGTPVRSASSQQIINTFCSLQRSYSARPRMSTAEYATLRTNEGSRRGVFGKEGVHQGSAYRCEGYPQSLADLYSQLSAASRVRPANLPLQVVVGHEPSSIRSPSTRREVRVCAGSLVNALYKCGTWLYVRTAEDKAGFIPLHCAQPISSSPRFTSCHVPQIRRASCRQRQLPLAAHNNRLNRSLSGSDCSRSDCDESGEVPTDLTEILSTDSAFSETHSFLSAPSQSGQHNQTLSDDDTTIDILENIEEKVMVRVSGQRGTPRKRCAVYLSPDKDLSVLFSRTLLGDEDLDVDSSFLTPTPHHISPTSPSSVTRCNSTLTPNNNDSKVHNVAAHQVDNTSVSSANASLLSHYSQNDTSVMSTNDKGTSGYSESTGSCCRKRSASSSLQRSQHSHPSVSESSDSIKKCRTRNSSRDTPASSKRLTVLFSYKALNYDDVSVRSQDVVTLIDDRAGDWLWVRIPRGKEGYIPKSCTVDLEALNLDPCTKTTYL